MTRRDADDPAAHAIALLQAGERPSESDLLRTLSSHACPSALVEELSHHRWILGRRRLLPLMLRHPACPRSFAWQALPRMGWNDLLQVARDPRTAPPIKRQAERKLVERVPQLTTGERTALARRAPRAIFASLLANDDPACIEALLDNSRFTESDALRLLNTNRSSRCLLVLVRHRRWGVLPAIRAAAVRSTRLPVGVALGLVALLPERELVVLVRSETVSVHVREAAGRLLEHRQHELPS